MDMFEDSPLLQATQRHQSGDLDEAITKYRAALEHNPNEPSAHRGLGLALAANNQLEAAISHLQRFLQTVPASPDIWNTLGTLLQRMGNAQGAANAFQNALQHDPNYVDALNNFGLLLRAANKLPEAAHLFQRAVQVQPENALLQFNFGIVLEALGHTEEALACFDIATKHKPDFAVAWNNLATLQMRRNQLENAETSFQTAIKTHAEYAEPVINLAGMYAAEGRIDEAKTWYDKAEAIRPSDRVKICRGLLLPTMMESAEAIEGSRKMLEQSLDTLLGQELNLTDPVTEVGRTAFYLTYHGQNDLRLQKKIAELYRRACRPLKFVAPHCGRRTKAVGEKIRIGFISTFFHNHTIGKLNLGLIKYLPRDQFEVELFTTPHSEDALHQELMDAADHVTIIPPQLFPARQRIAERKLDVAFYTDIGMEPLTYFLAFSRMAPVQCATWGHPVTTGLKPMDFFISSEHLDTEDAQAHYNEQLVRLPHLAVAFAKPDVELAGKTRTDFRLSNDDNLYICPQSLFKFHPEFDHVLAGILRQDPKGRIVLIESKNPAQTDALNARFAKTMADVQDRIIYLSRLSGEDFIRVIALCDVMLDPLHFGGGNTTYEALAVGTPVITLPSEFLRGRIAYALYQQMGYTDCIAENADDYMAKAVRLATDKTARKKASDRIMEKHDCLYDDRRGIEAFAEFCSKQFAQSKAA